ncbi:MAG: metalloregulator ArsR/SmtB family transcription factor [Vampirovibrio sp.]|nr:metalloregulator ArsR/SmtB family transcription factor [Vampirovibrio sp.]
MDKFAALADPNRRRMVAMIAEHGALAVKDIRDEFAISPPAVSQHLKVLREAKIITMEKRAQQRIYRINPKGIDEMQDWLSQMRQFWNERFDALDDVLKEDMQNRNE